MKKIVAIVVDFIIVAIIVVWGFILFKEFSSFNDQTSQLIFNKFNIKIILFGLFVITAVTIAFYLNMLVDKSMRPADDASEPDSLRRLSVSEMGDSEDIIGNLEVLRQLLGSNLNAIEKLSDNMNKAAAPVSEESLTEEFMLKMLTSQAKVLDVKSLTELLDAVVTTASELTVSKRVSRLLYNPSTKKLAMTRSIGVDVKEKIEIGTDEGVAGYAYKNSKRIYVTNIESHPEFGRENKPQYRSKSFVIFPIKVFSGVTVGVLNLTEKDPESGIYSMVDLEKLNMIVNSFSLKIGNMIFSSEFTKEGKTTEDLKKLILQFLMKV